MFVQTPPLTTGMLAVYVWGVEGVVVFWLDEVDDGWPSRDVSLVAKLLGRG